MNIIKELQTKGLDATIKKYGLVAKIDKGLVCLNYSQIDSPKHSPVADECRGLILESDTWKIVCRPFGRFYNYGEGNTTKVDSTNLSAYEKMDGSLIKVYYHNEEWHWATRSTVSGNSAIFHNTPIDKLSFNEVFSGVIGDKTIGELADENDFDKTKTHLFEMITPYNRIVVDYKGKSRLTYLCSVNNATGGVDRLTKWDDCARVIDFSDINSLLELADNQSGIDGEGFVIANREGKPLFKIKGASYVRLHHLNADGLTFRKVLGLILENEKDEFLTYFPNDLEFFTIAETHLSKIKDLTSAIFKKYQDKEMRDVGILHGKFKDWFYEEFSGYVDVIQAHKKINIDIKYLSSCALSARATELKSGKPCMPENILYEYCKSSTKKIHSLADVCEAML